MDSIYHLILLLCMSCSLFRVMPWGLSLWDFFTYHRGLLGHKNGLVLVFQVLYGYT